MKIYGLRTVGSHRMRADGRRLTGTPGTRAPSTARRHREPFLVNDEHWGLADWQFEEWEASRDIDGHWRQRLTDCGSEGASLMAA